MVGIVLLGDVKMNKIVKGSFVVRNFNTYCSRLEVGEVITEPVKDPLNQQLKAYIKWNGHHPYEIFISSLILKEEAEKKHSQLEEEFNKAKEMIEAKLFEANKFIKEANLIASSVNHSVKDIIDYGHPFDSEISKAGWFHSRAVC